MSIRTNSHAGAMQKEMSLMRAEALQSAEQVRRQLEHNAQQISEIVEFARGHTLLLTCARGSSDNAATFLRYLIEIHTGIPTGSSPPSLASIYQRPMQSKNTLAIAISQSGQSPDLIAYMRAINQGGAKTVAIVNDVHSPLTLECQHTIDLCAGPEISVAATKSYIASLAAALQLAAELSQEPALRASVPLVPAALEQACDYDWQRALQPIAACQSLYTLGRGPGLAIAQEAALKLKETCSIHAEAYSSAELRHGPLAIVDTDFPILAFGQNDESQSELLASVQALREQGARVFLAGLSTGHADDLPCNLDLPPATSLIAQSMSFYLLVDALCQALGRNPDQPPHLRKVTETR